jgi:tetratricopeptide (TPR) repeat protein
MLDPLVDDVDAWNTIRDMSDLRIDVAYIVGIGRLQRGDVEGASAALHLVESDVADADHVRRALAQVELARGDLEEAARFIVDSPEASRLDRVLAAKLAWRIGDTEGAVRRARQEMTASLDPGEHVWDVAGAILQIGRILADAGETDEAELAARAMANLLGDAPEDLPLLVHLRLLLASVVRLQGRAEDVLDDLEDLRLVCEGSDLGECLRERARSLAAIGRAEESRSTYREAVGAFDSAGERWEADATRREAGY